MIESFYKKPVDFSSLLFVSLLVITIFGVKAQNTSNTEITIGKNVTHLGRIANDTLVVITGSTYSFTVDTPEDQGLVSTNIDVAQLMTKKFIRY